MLLSTKRIVRVAAALVLSPLHATAASVVRRATICNGYSEFCDRSYGNISFVGAHDSYAVGTNNLAVNQDWNVTQQLTDGVRMLQMQAHNNSGTIQLCHTSCSLYNGGTLEDYLKQVKSWMDENTNDVVTLLIVNIDNLAPTVYAPVFEAAGLDTLSYAPGSATLTVSSWPSLGSMIDNNTRLVTFLDNAADITSVPYLLDEFTNVWETAFDVTDVNAFDCSVNRTKGDTTTQMFLINHFLDQVILGQAAPDVDQANETNAVSGTGSLGAQVATCESSVGKAPNFLLVDFYEYGNGSVFEVAATANGVTYSAKAIAQPQTGTSSSSSSSSSSNHALGMQANTQQLVSALTVVFGIVVGAYSVV